MAREYSLQPNEVVLLKEEYVAHGGRLATSTDQLILTNLNLVVAKKGMFGNSKEILVFPISQIKVWNGQAQALLGKSGTVGVYQLEVYFLNSQENFRFQTGGKKKILDWVAKIQQVVVGQSTPIQNTAGLALPGAERVADTLKDTFDVFKSRFGAKPPAPSQVAGKCGSCGAPITGVGGQVTTCPYCGAPQQL